VTAPDIHDLAGPAGAQLLDDVQAFIARFVVYPSPEALTASTLWVAHTHLLDAFESTPRIAHLSPEPGSGKTRALEVYELLVPLPLFSINCTPAALFRKVSDPAGRPTILFDEIDTVFGPRAKENEDLRGLLNAGHRRGATATRCVVKGKEITVEDLAAYAAAALSGLNDLPDTLLSRSVVIRMRRRAPHEQVEPFRRRLHAEAGEALRDRLAVWAQRVAQQVQDAWPDLPDGIVDRPADVWEPLLAVADAAGGDWPDRARVAAVSLVTSASQAHSQTLGVRLLADLRAIFTATEPEHLPTETILAELLDLDESPWGDLRGHPLDARGLARRVKPYEVTPKVIRVGTATVRGYARSDFADAWTRYLPGMSPLPPLSLSLEGHVTSETASHTDRDDWPCVECSKLLDPDDIPPGAIIASYWHPRCGLIAS